jgi:phage repressor protein C with HTH and peptisase S24 domain
MTEIERINFLIKTISNGKAADFARAINLRPSTLSRIRSGELSPRYKFEEILKAYPEVNRMWLETGEGYPGDLTTQLVKEHYEAKLRRADMVIDHLMRKIDMLEGLQKDCK